MNSSSEHGLACVGGIAAYQWIFTGDVKGSATLNQRCSICDRDDLSVMFQVRTAASDAISEICETCLGKGAVALQPGGSILRGHELRHQLGQMCMRVMLRTCKDVLRELLANTNDSKLPEVAVYFDRNAQLSPRHAATLFLILSNAGSNVDARIFQVQLRKTEHQQEFGRLLQPEKLALWPVLSPAIRTRLATLGFAPTPDVVQRSRGINSNSGRHVAVDQRSYDLRM
ncbi:hypothetical protein ABIB57_004407 [Devosia sp. UYZn731]|uniref:hypothetical protein n=1 Tax=Devosia sp. UYZn731 TaxID=3156345 RepID=UPI003391187B